MHSPLSCASSHGSVFLELRLLSEEKKFSNLVVNISYYFSQSARHFGETMTCLDVQKLGEYTEEGISLIACSCKKFWKKLWGVQLNCPAL